MPGIEPAKVRAPSVISGVAAEVAGKFSIEIKIMAAHGRHGLISRIIDQGSLLGHCRPGVVGAGRPGVKFGNHVERADRAVGGVGEVKTVPQDKAEVIPKIDPGKNLDMIFVERVVGLLVSLRPESIKTVGTVVIERVIKFEVKPIFEKPDVFIAQSEAVVGLQSIGPKRKELGVRPGVPVITESRVDLKYLIAASA